MKLIWHIVLKDWARLRLWLALWLTLYVLQVGLGFTLLYGDGVDLDWPVWLQLASAALILLQVVTGLIALCRLVHEDRLIGTDATWRTRPVAPARLLAAKLLTAVLAFGAAPVLVMVPWWLACGLGWPELWRAGLVALGFQALIILPAFWLASLTDTIGRFLLWLLVVGLGLVTVLLTMVWPGSGATDVSAARLWAAGAITLVTFLGVTVHRYLGRSRAASIVVSVIGLTVALAALAWWPWVGKPSLALAREPRPVPLAVASDAIAVTLLRAEEVRRESALARSQVRLRFGVDHVPSTNGVVGLSVHQAWTWPDGLRIARTDRCELDWIANGLPYQLNEALGLPELVRDPETVAWLQTRPGTHATPTGGASQRHDLFVQTALPLSVVARMRHEPPAYTATVEAALTRVEALVEFPLADRAPHRAAGQSLRVTALDLERADRVVITAIATTPAWHEESRQSISRLIGTLRLDPNSSPFVLSMVDTPFLVNRGTGEITLLNGRGRSVALICGVTISWSRLRAQAPKVRRGDAWVMRDEHWFDTAGVCVVRARGTEIVRQDLAIERFPLSERAAARKAADVEFPGWVKSAEPK